jgi:hypothetical protein
VSPRLRTTPLIVIALLLAALLATQAAAMTVAPAGERSDTGRVLGRTGFAFLGGLRTFTAAVVWNRLEPIFHDHYEGTPLSDQLYALPTMQLVTTLDPQFLDAYAIASYTVFSRGDEETGIQIARDGLEKNPRSGLMHANLAQLLIIQDQDANLEEAMTLAKAGLRDETYWARADDLFEGLVVFRTVYSLAGDEEMADYLNHMAEELHDSGELADHDHDHDGVQDH